MEIEQEILGFAPDGQPAILYRMTNAKGWRLSTTNIGAAIVSLEVPDRDGNMRDVVLGYSTYEGYLNDPAAMCKSVGRYANRIAEGRFSLGGKEYILPRNNGVNHLHGGPGGFQNKIWTSRVETDRVVFSYTSAAGEEGYPAELGCEAVYDFDDEGTVEITYFAGSDDDTIVNLTNHTYFNLSGCDSGSVLGHTLKIEASRYLPTDTTQIPTGELALVEGTPMDFREAKEIGRDIDADFEALKIGAGYDHCWAIDGYERDRETLAATLYSPESGIELKIYTTQPGIQVYTGNWLKGSGTSKGGRAIESRDGVALECQNFPDAPNKLQFPSPLLKKGEVYEEHIILKFGTR